MVPAYEQERAKIQGELDSIPDGETYSLFHREYPGPLVIRRPIAVVGKNATIWSAKGPVLQILCSGVLLKDLKVEVTAEDESGNGKENAIHVAPGCDVYLENVIVRGMVVGVPGEEGIWSYPNSLYLGQVAHGEEHRLIIRMAIPVACRLRSDIQGIDTRPHSLAPGFHEVELIVEKGVSKDTLILGTLSIATAFLTRHIALNGFVRVSDPNVGEFLHGRGQVIWEPPDWAAIIAPPTVPPPPRSVPALPPKQQSVPVRSSTMVQQQAPRPDPLAQATPPVISSPSSPPEQQPLQPTDSAASNADPIPQSLPSPPVFDPNDLVPRQSPRRIISTPINSLFIQNIKTPPVPEATPHEAAKQETKPSLSNVFTKPLSEPSGEQKSQNLICPRVESKRIKSSPINSIFQSDSQPKEPVLQAPEPKSAEPPPPPMAEPSKSSPQSGSSPSTLTKRKRMVKPAGVSSIFGKTENRSDGKDK